MISAPEFDNLIAVVDRMVDLFSLIGNYLSTSINDLLASLGMSVQLPGWAGGDLTPLVLMIGIGLPTYLAYQFIKWVTNVV